MMKTKNLIILAVVLVLLLSINLWQKRGHKNATSQSSVVELIAPGLVPDDLSRITLSHGEGDEADVTLENTPTGWTVPTAWNAAANMARIETLVRNLTGLTGEYRSDNAEVLPDYGLDAADALRIRAFNPAGEAVIALDVGRKPERYPGNFVRQPENDKVYVSQKNILAQLGIYGDPEAPKSRYFLELQALQEDRLEVDRVVVDSGEERLELVKDFAEEPVPEDTPDAAPTLDRNTWEWQLAGRSGVALAKTKVDAVLNSLVAIRANDLADPAAEPATYGLATPKRRAELHLQDGRVLVLSFGQDREAVDDAPAGTYMQIAGQPTVWVVTEYAIKNIFKSLSDLQAE